MTAHIRERAQGGQPAKEAGKCLRLKFDVARKHEADPYVGYWVEGGGFLLSRRDHAFAAGGEAAGIRIGRRGRLMIQAVWEQISWSPR